MFDQLFFRSDALTRHLSAPLVDERRQYLTHCAVQGMTKSTLEAKARLLLSIAEYLRLADRPSDTISLSEIKKAAIRSSNHNWSSPERSHAKRSREYFTAQAAKWLTFLNRFRTPPKPATVYDQMLAEFRAFMEEDRGLSPATVKGCCSSVRPFLIQLLDGRRSPEKITVSDVDLLLAQKVNEEHYARRSVRDYASSLRSFFRYAEMRGWCRVCDTVQIACTHEWVSCDTICYGTYKDPDPFVKVRRGLPMTSFIGQPVGGGQETRVVNVPVSWGHWALASRGIYFVDQTGPKPVIEFYNFSDRKITHIATLEKPMPPEEPGLDISPDERTILFLPIVSNKNINLVENFR
jgi:Phage integrase, N-terminal SAM-like domain